MIFLVLGWTNANADIDPKFTKYLLYCERLDVFGEQIDDLLDEQYHLILEFQDETHTWGQESQKLNKDVFWVNTHYLKSFENKSRREEGYLFYYKSPKYFTIYGFFGSWFLSMNHDDFEMMTLNRETLEIDAKQKHIMGDGWWYRKFECELYDKSQREQAIKRIEEIAENINKRRTESIKRNKI